jgi:hypothetical protein
MAETNAFFVQFPHPGGEHHSPTDDLPWNVADHRRKFLVAPGQFREDDDRVGEADLVFWGEWEPPSRVERRWPADGRLPRSLQRPYWTRPATNGFRQNTDPWVWGEQMVYSNCKQITGPQRRRTSMQELTPGSVICFGSTIDGDFCVDTVLVVASAEPWVPAEVDDLDVSGAFKICTAHSVATAPGDAHLRLTLYRGATANDPVDGMYSFVPARRADERDPRFGRPSVRLSGRINPASRQSTWGSKRPLSVAQIRHAWESIHDQVLAHDLLLATRIETPAPGGTTSRRSPPDDGLEPSDMKGN